jgi:hypothetical protein
MPVPTGELLDSKQCAGLLGVHEITLVVWRRENRGPPWLSGPDAKVVLYEKQSILNWLTKHTPQPENDARRMMRLRTKAGTHAVRDAMRPATPAKKQRRAAK